VNGGLGVDAHPASATRVTDLPAPWCDDPYLLEHGHQPVVAAWAAHDGLVTVLDEPGRDRVLVGIGSPEAVAGLLVRAFDEGTAAQDGAVDDDARSWGGSTPYRAALTRGSVELLDPAAREALRLGAEGSSWDWMWTARPLKADASRAERLVLGPRTAEEVGDFLSRGHPTASTAPDDSLLIGWWGVRSERRLVAAVGAIVFAPGVAPHLVSLGVDPAFRGRGLAGVVMAAAVRDCLDVIPSVGAPRVSLGLYASNDVARRVYRRLGFTLRHEFTSWAVRGVRPT
jgi:ribosomal protein S18 acetylase RimI-like enzyme